MRVVAGLGGGRRTEAYRCEGRRGRVVVKLVRPGRDGAAERALVRREVAAHDVARHASLAALVAHGVDDDPPWLAVRHVEGPTLAATVDDDGPLDEDAVRRTGTALAGALAALHAAGWVHLDVKPTNVLLGRVAVLLDMGAARPVADAARSRGGLGTWHARSPEQQDPSRFGAIGPASDVWGLGVVLLFAATGAAPLRARRAATPPDEAELARRARAATGSAPLALRPVLLRCLATDPARRPPLAEVADLLRLPHRPLPPRPTGP